MKVLVIGGGAAGFFSAIQTKLTNSLADVIIVEKTGKVLQKVLVSGGGRCNVTHNCLDNKKLIENYPRGHKELYSVFHQFSVKDTITFFESRGVPLKTEEDGRMFPTSDNSESIADCLYQETNRQKIKIQLNTNIYKITQKSNESFHVWFNEQDNPAHFDKIILAQGGIQNAKSIEYLHSLNLIFVPSYPSIFTFKVSDKSIFDLAGTSCKVSCGLVGNKFISQGPLLFTHWGFSGPAILKLSAWEAKTLLDCNYQHNFFIQWMDEKLEAIKSQLLELKKGHPLKEIGNSKISQDFSTRLWEYLIQRAGIEVYKRNSEITNKLLNKLAEILYRDIYPISGKGVFKEEFVQAGGIDLKTVNMKTMESKIVPNLFFCGEILNIDGITGGFNFQAAWSTGYLAGLGAGE